MKLRFRISRNGFFSVYNLWNFSCVTGISVTNTYLLVLYNRVMNSYRVTQRICVCLVVKQMGIQKWLHNICLLVSVEQTNNFFLLLFIVLCFIFRHRIYFEPDYLSQHSDQSRVWKTGEWGLDSRQWTDFFFTTAVLGHTETNVQSLSNAPAPR